MRGGGGEWSTSIAGTLVADKEIAEAGLAVAVAGELVKA